MVINIASRLFIKVIGNVILYIRINKKRCMS